MPSTLTKTDLPEGTRIRVIGDGKVRPYRFPDEGKEGVISLGTMGQRREHPELVWVFIDGDRDRGHLFPSGFMPTHLERV